MADFYGQVRLATLCQPKSTFVSARIFAIMCRNVMYFVTMYVCYHPNVKHHAVPSVIMMVVSSIHYPTTCNTIQHHTRSNIL
jgi:hypothetical protein